MKKQSQFKRFIPYVLLLVSTILLYVNSHSAINKLLFFVSIGLVVGILLSIKDTGSKMILKDKKYRIYVFLFVLSSISAIGSMMFTLFEISNVLNIIILAVSATFLLLVVIRYQRLRH